MEASPSSSAPPPPPCIPVSSDGSVWADASPLLEAAGRDLHDGEIVHGENFSLFGAMSALEKPALVVEESLSRLPNDVLLNIIERLDTRDAVRTCILSKQMCKLPNMLSKFVVDALSFAPSHGNKLRGMIVLTMPDVIRMSRAVADATDNILNSRSQQISLREINIQFYLRNDDCLSIGKAVARAMATHNLDKAQFTIMTEKQQSFCATEDCLFFAKQLKSFFAAFPDVFAGLTSLHIENLKFEESDIPNILSTCKRLESLHLFLSHSGIYTTLEVQHPQLVELQITLGYFRTVRLQSLPKLKRMQYDVWGTHVDPLYFGHVPLLSSLSLGTTCVSYMKILKLSQLLTNATSLTDLHMDFKSEMIWVQPESPELLAPMLQKLQFVNLVDIPEGCSLAWTMFILEAAPSIQELCITVWDHLCHIITDKNERIKRRYSENRNVEWKSSASDFTHKNLSKLTIYGFQPDDNFMGYIRNMMEAAVNLKEISLYDRNVCSSCDYLDPEIKAKVSPSRYPRTDEEKDLLRRQITEGLEVALPDVIQFRS